MLPTLSELMAPTPALYSIASGRPFLRDLATYLVRTHTDRLDELGRVTIFLPNKRAARQLGSQLFDAAKAEGHGTVLLPRLRALGEVDEEDLLFSGEVPALAVDLPPPASTIERRALLATLVKQKRADASWASCLAAADDLARLLDTFHLEGVSLDSLDDSVPAEIAEQSAEHWQKGFEFLQIIRIHWPVILSANGWMESAERQRKLVEALAQSITDHARSDPIIVAGSLGTVRATGKLIDAVARHSEGLVILPGLDVAMDDRSWNAIDAPHPQALFRERLTRDFGDIDRTDVHPWPVIDKIESNGSRRQLLSLALRPAKATDDWYAHLTEIPPAVMRCACRGLSIAAANTEDEEAVFVALAIREALETPGKTVMVVTPDRDLAQRISAKLLAWNIVLDDTGGVPICGTYRGTFLRLIAAWFDDPSDCVRLLALLTHPLAAFGVPAVEWGPALRALDKSLRGRRVTYCFDDFVEYTRSIFALSDPTVWSVLQPCFDVLSDTFDRFTAAETISEKVTIHIELAEALATTPDRAGAHRLWEFEDGEALAEHLAGILTSPTWAGVALSKFETYTDIFDGLLGSAVVRRRGGHPRVRIFGLLEARLQSANLTILSGLSEGVWPDSGKVDGFLSRPMREALGLPTTEQLIGRAAHDFIEAAACSEVLLTRSARRGQDPATPSRWMVRLESVLRHCNLMSVVNTAPRLRQLARLRHQSKALVSIVPPLPKPPITARPRRFSVSDVEVLLRDPYSIYAKHVLGLRVMDRLAREAEPRDRGTVYHRVMELLAEKFPVKLPDDFEKAVWEEISNANVEANVPLIQERLWTRSLEDLAEFAAQYEREARTFGGPLMIEQKGEWSFPVGTEEIKIVGRVDRVDQWKDGTVSVVDFKSGEARPTTKQMTTFSPQLHLNALMVEAGVFQGLPIATVGQISFVRFRLNSKRTVYDSLSTLDGSTLTDSLAEVRIKIAALFAGYMKLQTGYPSQPRSFFHNTYGDYDQLARRGEWAAVRDV